MMSEIPFSTRFGVCSKKLITDDFLQSARVGLYYIFIDLIEKDLIEKEYNDNQKFKYINFEINRICRNLNRDDDDSNISRSFYEMEWFGVYNLVERLYLKLKPNNDFDGYGHIDGDLYDIEYVKTYFTNEIKHLMAEENIGYDFDNGMFYRKGHISTIKSIKAVAPILSNEKLVKAKEHYNKALKFFQNIKTPDFENSIKESFCALEASLIALHSPEIAKNFEHSIKNLEGYQKEKSPPPIIESIIKLYGYRNSGNGIAHATQKEIKVSEKEAELILALVADYITYFYSLLNKDEYDVPF